MANISELLKKILAARYGKEVRGSIHDAIDAMNTQIENDVPTVQKLTERAESASSSANTYASAAQSSADKASGFSGSAKVYSDNSKASAAEAKQAVADAKGAAIMSTTASNIKDTLEAPMLVTKATKNLLKPTLQTTTQNGVTYLKNENGTYSISGKMTDASIASYTTIITLTLSKGRYKFIGGISKSKYVRLILKRSNGNENLYDYGDGVVFEANEEKLEILLIVNENPSANDIFKPMLTTDISATYDDFVPYDGYEIKSCGKNLLDPNAAGTYDSPHTENGITFTKNNDGSWTINGTATANVGMSVGNSGGDHTFIELEADAKAFLFGSSGVSGLAYGFYTNESKQISNNENIPKGTKIRNLWISCYKGNTFNNVKVLGVISYDLNLADTMYVPYQDGGTVQITPSTEFPLLGLKSFDGETNIISPGNVEVSHALTDTGKYVMQNMKDISDIKAAIVAAGSEDAE